MARSKKTAKGYAVDEFVGRKVAAFRNEHGWTLAELSERLDVSVSHLKALESGRYSFTVSMLVSLAETFKRSTHAFLPITSPRESQLGEWIELHGALLNRDRAMLTELGRKLVGWSDAPITEPQRPSDLQGARTKLIALEGIDGVVLRDLGKALVTKLGKTSHQASLVWYDFEDPLTQHLVDRIRIITSATDVDRALQHSHAYEKTLLFACERLQRQETRVRTELSRGFSVITPFFTMAAGVYQKVDGTWDQRVVEAIESLLLRPDLVVVVDSDPALAASRATLKTPLRGEFYSPYEKVDQFDAALRLYLTMCQEFKNRGYRVLHIDSRSVPSIDGIATRVLDELSIGGGRSAPP